MPVYHILTLLRTSEEYTGIQLSAKYQKNKLHTDTNVFRPCFYMEIFFSLI